MTKQTEYKALDSKVLVVAVANIEVGDWAAYIGAVPGDSHDREWVEVASGGTKLPYKLAQFLFPNFDKEFSWRE